MIIDDGVSIVDTWKGKWLMEAHIQTQLTPLSHDSAPQEQGPLRWCL